MRGEIAFVKMTGSGNDFIIIDNREAVLGKRDVEDFVRRLREQAKPATEPSTPHSMYM